MGVNRVILIGNVGKDPEIRMFENGGSVANFSLATSETYKNKNGEKMVNTEWHNIVIWGSLVAVVEKYVKKGMSLYIEGKIKSRSYDDKDGNKRYITEIYAGIMQMLNNASNSAPMPEPNSFESLTEDDEPDFPF